MSAEQQTHNFYAEHGFMYGNNDLKRLYAEICDVEEEHVTMYETLIDPNETMIEKWVIHEFCEVCNYYNCYKDEVNDKLKLIWEEMTQMELAHLHLAIDVLKKCEKRTPEEIIGSKIVSPCHFESQKQYVAEIINSQADKRLGENYDYLFIDELPKDWASYEVQKQVSKDGAPSEKAVWLGKKAIGRDIANASEEMLHLQPKILKRAIEPDEQAPNTVSVEEYQGFNKIPPLDFLN